MNFLPGVLRRSGSDSRVEFAGGVWLPVPVGSGQDGQQVIYGTRPEHIELASGDEGVATEVVVVEPTGADTQVFTKIAGMEVASVSRPSRLPPRRDDPPAP